MRKIQFDTGKIYHIFNRGVEKRDIFLEDRDRWRFLQGLYLFNEGEGTTNLLYRLEQEKKAMNFRILKEFIVSSREERKPLVRIMADCLMPNHFHLILEEIQEGGISRFMHKFGVGYTNYFNKKYERVGSLFQGTFKAVEVEADAQLQYLLVYVNVVNPGQLFEPNLKEDGVMDVERVLKFAREYLWGTHREYMGIRESVIIDKGMLGEMFPSPKKYEQFARDILLGRQIDKISRLMLE
ncbi:transposase [Patescibacteria group bacterium]|nr:transposase [Patescibacteria group bacterium]